MKIDADFISVRKPLFIAFFLAVSFHVMLFVLGSSFYKAPEYGVRAGNSNLEVGLVDAAPMEKTPSATFCDKIKTAVIKKEAALAPVEKSAIVSEQHHQTIGKNSSVASENKLVGSLKAAPTYLHNPQPVYPESERQAGHEGIVLLRVAIDCEGKVSRVVVERSSGYLGLDERALQTVIATWKFHAAELNHEKISSEIFVPIHFRLKE